MTATVEQLMEGLKDPKFVIERFFWIVNREAEKVPFIFNAVQKKFYKARSRFDLILKARKEGFTSLILAMWLTACLFIPNTRAVVVSHEDEATKRLFKKVKYYLETFGGSHFNWKVDVDDDNKKSISFPATNSSFWIGTAGSRAFGRGDDITHLLLTEVAHYMNQEFVTGVLEACIDKAHRIMETTANGVGELFNTLWDEACDPKSGSVWKPHFYAWYEDVDYRAAVPADFRPTGKELRMRQMIERETGIVIDDEQIYWYRQKMASMADKNLMPQEYPSNPREAFVSSGRHIFNLHNLDIMWNRANAPLFVGQLEDDDKEIRLVDSPDGTLSIWKMPRQGHRYWVPADVAEGVQGGAYSVAPVFDRSSWEVVAELRLRCDPGDFGRMLCTLGEFYSWALLGPEANNHGHATLEAMTAKRYPHILKTTDFWPDEPEKLGFPTDERTKELIISALRNAVDEMTYFENSKAAINEMRRAVRDDNGRMISEGVKSQKDGVNKKKLNLDCVITRGIGLYGLKFLTLDESYREPTNQEAPIIVSQIAGYRNGNSNGHGLRRAF